MQKCGNCCKLLIEIYLGDFILADNDHHGHRQRLRDRIKSGAFESMQDYQVLEYALTFVVPFKDVNPLAHELVKTFGSFGAVLEADIEDLKQIKGISDVTACFLTSLPKIFNFYEKEKNNKVGKICNYLETYEYGQKLFKGKTCEEVYLISLLATNKIVGVDKISEGTCNESNCSIRKITDCMSRRKVANIILLHNHPNGLAEPSEEDKKVTKALVYALAITGSHLIDHMIICDNSYYSFKQDHLIDDCYLEISKIFGGAKGVQQPKARYSDD